MALGALAAATPAAPPVKGAAEGSPAELRLAGTYKIESWESLERRGIHHFFYLHPEGFFLLVGEWPGNERSRFVGTWRASEGLLLLAGQGHVETNQGAWDTPFQRAFAVREGSAGLPRLEPVLEKNRYGVMGWPQAFVHFSDDPRPDLPGVSLPAEPQAILRLIRELLGAS